MGWPSYNHPLGSKRASTMFQAWSIPRKSSSIFQIHLTSINYLGICNTDETIKNLHQLLHIVTLWFDIHVPPVLGRCSPVSQLLIHLFTKAMDQRAQGWRGREGEYLSDGMPTFSHGAMDSHGWPCGSGENM